jgi:hypothetical protein
MNPQISVAKEILKEAGRYLDLADAFHAAQLLEEAERIVTALAEEQTTKTKPTRH